jgi:hypothetical protein
MLASQDTPRPKTDASEDHREFDQRHVEKAQKATEIKFSGYFCGLFCGASNHLWTVGDFTPSTEVSHGQEETTYRDSLLTVLIGAAGLSRQCAAGDVRGISRIGIALRFIPIAATWLPAGMPR